MGQVLLHLSGLDGNRGRGKIDCRFGRQRIADFLQVDAKVGDGLVAMCRVLGECAIHDLLQFDGHAIHGARRLVQDGHYGCGDVIAPEWIFAREDFVEHHA